MAQPTNGDISNAVNVMKLNLNPVHLHANTNQHTDFYTDEYAAAHQHAHANPNANARSDKS